MSVDAPQAAPHGVLPSVFAALSRLRGKRIFHPHGVGFEAELALAGGERGAELFDRTDPVPAIVRLSRSIGLPEALADPVGLAIRFPAVYGPGRDQDFLLVSSARAPVARHLLLPSRGFSARTYSCLLPYRIGEGLVLIGAEPLDPPPGPNLAELRGRARGGLAFGFTLASPGGDWRRIGELRLGARLPDTEIERVRFNPAHSGGGIEPVGFLNGIRPASYRGSQAGRGATEQAGAGHTDRVPAEQPG